MADNPTSLTPRPLALITGASSGIGLELAKQFADNGFDLVVNAEDDAIVVAAEELRTTTDASVEHVQADLRTAEGVAQVYAAATAGGRPLAAAALNAGVGQGQGFLDTDIDKQLEVIDLNVTSTVRLAHLVLRDMTARGEGRVLVTSSIASTMPGSFQAVYNASKSFLQSFTEALQDELRDTGVTLTSLMPGPTDTEFFERAEMQDTRVGQTSSKDDPAKVAKQGFEALMSGKDKVLASSLSTKLQGVANKVLPDKAKAVAHRLMAEPGKGD
jgi:short-subunit dehydrogenase